jgi:hypothetical protein
MSQLERRYRSALRLLPAGYRALWEEEMVATFLDSMQTDDPEEAEYLTDFGRPRMSELASVAALAVRLRIGTTGGVPARYLARGAALRLVALLLLLFNAIIGTMTMLNQLWLASVLPYLPKPSAEWASYRVPIEAWRLAWWLSPLLWPLAYLALVAGQRLAARLLAALATLAHVVALVSQLVNRDWHPWSGVLGWSAYELTLNGLLLFALAAFGRDAPRLRLWPWLLAPVAGTSLGYAVLFGTEGYRTSAPPLDLDSVPCLALATTGTLLLIGPRLGLARRSAAWSQALAILCAAAVGLRVISLVGYAQAGMGDTAALILGIAEAAALLVVGTALTVQAGRELRRLPEPAEAASWSGSG